MGWEPGLMPRQADTHAGISIVQPTYPDVQEGCAQPLNSLAHILDGAQNHLSQQMLREAVLKQTVSCRCYQQLHQSNVELEPVLGCR
jgi:hypothetical protein